MLISYVKLDHALYSINYGIYVFSILCIATYGVMNVYAVLICVTGTRVT